MTMTKVFIDPGHGGKDSGAVGNGIKEKDIVLKIGLRLRDILKYEYEGVNVSMSREDDTFLGLSERAKKANNWGANVFVSLHNNSFNTVANGFETFIYLRTPNSTASLQNVLHTEIMAFNKMYGIRDRGQQRKDLAVIRESNMDAILSENLFIDNEKEAALLKTDAYIAGIADAHAKGLAKVYGWKRKNNPEQISTGSDTRYRVIAGSFKDRKNADEMKAHLESLGVQGVFLEVK